MTMTTTTRTHIRNRFFFFYHLLSWISSLRWKRHKNAFFLLKQNSIFFRVSFWNVGGWKLKKKFYALFVYLSTEKRMEFFVLLFLNALIQIHLLYVNMQFECTNAWKLHTHTHMCVCHRSTRMQYEIEIWTDSIFFFDAKYSSKESARFIRNYYYYFCFAFRVFCFVYLSFGGCSKK